MGMTEKRGHDYGVSVWGFVLIGGGVIWMLTSLNILSLQHFSVLFKLWPLVLIAIGVQLLIGRSSRERVLLIGFGTIAVLLVLMVVGPSIGLSGNIEAQRASYSEPLDGAESAQVEIGVGVGDLRVNALDDSNDLIDADLNYVGEINYEVEGDSARIIRLNNEPGDVFNFAGLFNALASKNALRWDVRLSPSVPLDLNIHTGTASSAIDLSALNLEALDMESGTGSVDLTLPAGERAYEAQVNSGTGSVDVTIAEGAALTLVIEAGTGSVDIDIPDGAAVRLEAETGTGSMDVASSLRLISGDLEGPGGHQGIWESEGFASAERRINIQFNGGTGSLDVR